MVIKKIIFVFRIKYLGLYLNREEEDSVKIFMSEKKSKSSLIFADGEVLKGLDSVLDLDPVKFISFNVKLYPQSYINRLFNALPKDFLGLNPSRIKEVIEKINDPNGVLVFVNYIKKEFPSSDVYEIINNSNMKRNIKKLVFQRM